MTIAAPEAVVQGTPGMQRRAGLLQRIWDERAWALTLADQGIVSLLNLTSGVLVARSCSKEDFGLYGLALLTAQLCQTFPDALIAQPYTVFSPRSSGREHAAYTGSALLLQGLLSLLLSLVVGVAAAVEWATASDPALGRTLATVAAFLAFLLLRQSARQLGFANRQPAVALALDACVAVVQVFILAALWATNRLTPPTAISALGVATAIPMLGWLWWMRPQLGFDWARFRFHVQRNWLFSRWLLASAVLWTLSVNLYPWILTAFGGAAAAADWYSCLQVVGVLSPLLQGLQNVAGPKIAHAAALGGPDAMRSAAFSSARIFAAVLGPMVLVLALAGDRIVPLVFGDKYLGNGVVTAMMAFHLFLLGLTFSFSRALFALERSDVDLKINLVLLVLLLTAGIAAASRYGVVGAASVQLSGSVLALGLQYFAFHSMVVRTVATQRQTIG